jgi:hypothetical protein
MLVHVHLQGEQGKGYQGQMPNTNSHSYTKDGPAEGPKGLQFSVVVTPTAFLTLYFELYLLIDFSWNSSSTL